MKLETLIAARPTLQSLAKEKLPAQVAYRLYRNIDKINPELESFENAQKDLFARYGEEKDGLVTIDKDNQDAFVQEMTDLLATEVELDIRPIKIDDLANAQLSASEVMTIAFLLEE